MATPQPQPQPQQLSAYEIAIDTHLKALLEWRDADLFLRRFRAGRIANANNFIEDDLLNNVNVALTKITETRTVYEEAENQKKISKATEQIAAMELS